MDSSANNQVSDMTTDDMAPITTPTDAAAPTYGMEPSEMEALRSHLARWGFPASHAFVVCSAAGLAIGIACLAYVLYVRITGNNPIAGLVGTGLLDNLTLEFVPILMFALNLMLSRWVDNGIRADGDIPSPSNLLKTLVMLQGTMLVNIVLILGDKVIYGESGYLFVTMLLLGLVPSMACYVALRSFSYKASDICGSHKEPEGEE